jgi:hypothetical protein
LHRHCQSSIYFVVFSVVLPLIRGGKINLRDSLDQVGGMNDGPQNTKEFYPVNCMSRLTESRSVSVMTVRLGHYFFFHLSFPFPYLLYYGHPPFAPCYCLELDLSSDTKMRTRCLADCALLPLSITRPIPTSAIPLMRASVPADVHPSCPFYARISSPLPYVSLHPLCTLPDPLTCVIPRPLYTLS